MTILMSLFRVETELYESGASRHMSPYRHRFENYKPIEGKAITAGDKQLFQAIGVGDSLIKIPNGKGTAIIRLKHVLHAPDLGLTLVSTSSTGAAVYSSLCRGVYYRKFDPKQRLIGAVRVKNGLYQVDHESEPKVMVASTKEVLTIEELHRRMGHISPDAARELVKGGAVEGIDIAKRFKIECLI
jgi:hypothetical protein